MRCAYPPYESPIRRCSVDALRLSTLRSPIRRCSVDALRLSTLRSPIRRCSVDALRLSTLRKPNPLLFGGCAALIHPTKAESAAVRWMRCAYPPYESRIRHCSVDALRLSTLRKPDSPLFGGCAALIHPTKAESAAVRWMRCAYPPYEARFAVVGWISAAHPPHPAGDKAECPPAIAKRERTSMSNYRRALVAGGTYFFTLVTHSRQPILASPDAIAVLRSAFRKVKATRPFTIEAMVVLPDHLHCIWRIQEADTDYASRWREIKKAVSRQIAPGSDALGERRVWQRRYWEHLIRDEDDWRRHVAYIHYNPVKHGLVARAADWPWSSFSRFVARGWHEPSWGDSEPAEIRGLSLE